MLEAKQHFEAQMFDMNAQVQRQKDIFDIIYMTLKKLLHLPLTK